MLAVHTVTALNLSVSLMTRRRERVKFLFLFFRSFSAPHNSSHTSSLWVMIASPQDVIQHFVFLISPQSTIVLLLYVPGENGTKKTLNLSIKLRLYFSDILLYYLSLYLFKNINGSVPFDVSVFCTSVFDT